MMLLRTFLEPANGQHLMQRHEEISNFVENYTSFQCFTGTIPCVWRNDRHCNIMLDE